MYAVLADDLTGAGDAGVQFAAAGLRTRTLLDGWTAADLQGADVVAVATDSRHLLPPVAYARVHAAGARLRAAAVEVVYKKIDSTGRGPLAAEIEAVLDACELPLAVVCPAYPALGRTLRSGVLLVNHIPVTATAAGTDPHAPVHESHLPTLLARGTRRPVHLVTRPTGGYRHASLAAELAALGAHAPSGGIGGLVVCDAEEDADLAAIVAAARTQRARTLLVGSAGMARPLAAILAAQVTAQAETQAPHCVLVLCGSLHPAARAQVHYLEQSGNPRVKLLITAAPAQDYLPGPPTGETLSGGASPAAQLAEEAAAWLAAQGTAGIAGVVVTGGDTLQALLRALAARGVDLEQEIAPGVPLGHIAGGPWAGLPLISKAGGFGGPALLADAAALLLELDRRRHGKDKQP